MTQQTDDLSGASQPGLPAQASVVREMVLDTQAAPVSAYRIIRTNETDAYDGTEEREFTVPPRSPDSYAGTSRKAAKLSIAAAPLEVFSDLKSLVASLTADKTMIAHKPPITTDATSDRVAEEQRNIRVRAWLYAASKEADNDFHLIIGSDPQAKPITCMTMELSGLPPSRSRSYRKLKQARDAFKQFFGTQLPGMTYDFYNPPIPVELEGSLFFDMTHAKGQKPGPQSLRPFIPTIWEVHPITSMKFEP